MPVPGTTTPEPSPLVQVVLHAIPAASITEMWVVEPRRLDRKPRRNASAERPSRNSAVRSDWAAAIASTMTGSDGGAGPRSRGPREEGGRVAPARGGGVGGGSPRGGAGPAGAPGGGPVPARGRG